MNVDELLDLILFGTDYILSLEALSLFHLNNVSLLEAASDSNFFLKNYQRILSKDEDVTDRQLSLFAELCETVLLVYPESIGDAFSFFNKFIKFSDNYAVSLLLKRVLENNEELAPIHLYLESSKFVEKIVQLINEYHIIQSSDEKLSCLYKLLTLCLQNDVLASQCMKPSVIHVAFDLRDYDIPHVLNSQWELISELCLPTNVKDFIELFDNAICAIDNACEIFYPFQEHAINFIAKLIRYFPKSLQNIDVDLLFRNLKNIVIEFPNNTVSLKAVQNVVIIGIRSNEFQESFVDSFVPFYADLLKTTNSRISHAFAYNILQKIRETCEYDRSLNSLLQNNEEFNNVMRNEVRIMKELITREYGKESVIRKYEQIIEPISSPLAQEEHFEFNDF